MKHPPRRSPALRNAACAYAAHGWAVLPLRPHGKAPLGRLVPRGVNSASSDLVQALDWWTDEPAANVGIAAHASGLVVLDIDPRNGGDDELAELEGTLGKLPRTVEAVTGGGGAHYLFRHPGVELVGKLGRGVDVKDHGFIVAPPSLHPTGGRYLWDIEPGEAEVAQLPAAWLDKLRAEYVAPRPAPERPRVVGSDAIRDIDAAEYIEALTGREVNRGGYVSCPFHGDGQETKPSLHTHGTLWTCYGCEPPPGRRANGGDIYNFAAQLWGCALPLRGTDFAEVAGRLRAAFVGVSHGA